MREHLETLPKEQAMFLLTLMMLEGEKDLELLRFLPDEQAQAIESISHIFTAEPRKQMLPKIVREIKALIKAAQRSLLEQFEPEWIADFLKDESPRVISALLQQYPRSSADRIVMALPAHLRQRIPQASHQMHPEITRYIKHKFDAICPQSQPSIEIGTTLTLASTCQLEPMDLSLLIRELGLRELAAAFRSAGKGALTELCRVLNPPDAERLLEIIRALPHPIGSPEAKEEMKSAARVLQATTKQNRTSNKSQLIEDAGFTKLREATLELSPEEQQTIMFRLPYQLGKKFQMSNGANLSPKDTYRIQCELLQVIQQLSQEGKLPSSWSQLEIDFPPPPPEQEASTS